MGLIADLALGLGSLCAAVYCYVLARRLKRFSTLETEMGGAIAVLSAQVDDMTKALKQAQTAARENADRLQVMTERAEAVASRLQEIPSASASAPVPSPMQTLVDPAEPAADADAQRRLRFVRRRQASREQEAVL